MVVQGDTSSALGGTLGAAMAGVPVAHVEAGLRSHDRANPWPEEDFRIAIDAASDLLFAPTHLNAANLRREGVRGRIFVTGNTGIDALLELNSRLPEPSQAKDGTRRLLVTCHRRESWGDALQAIAGGLRLIGERHDVLITMVLHPNPAVADEMRRLLDGALNIVLRNPCAHAEMLQLMSESDLILSDSGGVQEEAPALGISLLVLRDRTERPEGVAAGNALVVGRTHEAIVGTVEGLLDDKAMLAAMSGPAFPYGDGAAAPRIAAVMEEFVTGTQPCSPASPRQQRKAN